MSECPGGRGSPTFSRRPSESQAAPTRHGPAVARAPTGSQPGTSPRKGSCGWDVPGQGYPPHFVHEPLRYVQQRVWDNLRCHSSRPLEARRLVTFKAPGDGVDGPALRPALRAAFTKLEKLLLRGLLDGAADGTRPRGSRRVCVATTH